MLKQLLAALLQKARPAELPGELSAHTHIQSALAQRDHAMACRLCRQQIALEPLDQQAWAWLAYSQAMQRDYAGSAASFRRLAELAPESRTAHANLGNLALMDMQLADAESHYRNALACPIQADEAFADATLHTSLGFALMRQGQPEEAIVHLRRALEEQPDNLEAAGHLLFALQHAPGLSPHEHHAQSLRFARVHEHPLLASRRVHANVPDPHRPLRIGYVSGDFAQHAVANFIEPVLAAHKRNLYETVCYSNRIHQDSQTAMLRSLAGLWRDIAALTDEDAAQRVVADGVDILVDLSGHTFGNRLGLFARRPAPLQITWLGYPASTGLASMDYRISDAVADPPGIADSCHSETLLRLPRSQWCYRPSPQAPPVSPLPALTTGHIMFGSFNRLAKLNDSVLCLWGRLLANSPSAALTVATLMDEKNAQRVRTRLISQGAHAGQVRILGNLDDTAFWNIRAQIDIALDSHPYNGTTTTCEALWAGLPVVTLAGSSGAARTSASLLQAAGLPELIAHDEQGYLDTALRLAQDLPALARLRAGLRDRMLSHGLCDSARFTGELETAYRQVWQAWCRDRTAQM